VRLGYALTTRGGARVDFEETLAIPASLGPLRPADEPAIARALLGLHLAGGTSYWKTSIPDETRLEGTSLDESDAAFWNDVYTLGMGEFFFRNGIDPSGHVPFRPTTRGATPTRAARLSGPTLLLWGGGKDSVVSHEVLRQADEPHELLSIGRSEWVWPRRSAETAGMPLHVIERRLDPKLLEMNAAGALNGHVPVNAYLAFAGALTALLTGRAAIIASNEASASAGNAVWHGIDVNHQWSKSLEFERKMRAWALRHLGGAPEYVSLMRPLSELRIMKAFATHEGYFGNVTSCNANFRLDSSSTRRWCLTCAKCVFVSLMARPWLDDASYHALFGGDALADPANATIVEELLGLRGAKPFECVGTPEETIAALHIAKTKGRGLPHGVMTLHAQTTVGSRDDFGPRVAGVLSRNSDHELSALRLAQLDAYLDRH